MSAPGSARISRRRFLRISASAAACTALPAAAMADAMEASSWRGIAFGGLAGIELRHPDPARMRRTLAMATAEIERLESIMSLYRADSALSQLNRLGHLDPAPADLVQILSTARDFAVLSGGAFDITVQPLWQVYADHFATPRADRAGPPRAVIQRAVEKVDYRAVEIEPAAVRLARRGMALTLNGIAQGYITDRITDLLKNEGFEHVLADLGEIRAMGQGRDGSWRAAIRNPTPHLLPPVEMTLQDQALATSGSYGFQFDGEGQFHHLFEPRSGACPHRYASVSVIARDATRADALATACNLLPPEAIAGLLRSAGAIRAHLIMPDGAVRVVDA